MSDRLFTPIDPIDPEDKATLASLCLKANLEEAADLDLQAAMAEWDVTLSDGLPPDDNAS